MYSYNWALGVVKSFYKSHTRATYIWLTFPEQSVQSWAHWVASRDPRWETLKSLIKSTELIFPGLDRVLTNTEHHQMCIILTQVYHHDIPLRQNYQLTSWYFQRILDLRLREFAPRAPALSAGQKNPDLPGQLFLFPEEVTTNA